MAIREPLLGSPTPTPWTFGQIKAGWVNPLEIIKKNGIFGENTYVTDAWSAKTIGVTKRNWDLIGQSKGPLYKRAINAALVMAGTYFVNVSGCNFVKGTIGLVYSAVKAVFHTVSFGVLLTLGLAALFVGRPEILVEAIKHLKLLLIDAISMIACAGHMVPFWVPILLTILLAPHISIPIIGLIYGGVKLASKFTGIADVMAYVPNVALLTDQHYRSTHPEALDAIDKDPKFLKIEDPDARARAIQGEKDKIVQDSRQLLHELKPHTSSGGAFISSLMLHVLTAAAVTVVDTFVPGVGPIASKAIEYGPPAALFIGSNVIRACRADPDNAEEQPA